MKNYRLFGRFFDCAHNLATRSLAVVAALLLLLLSACTVGPRYHPAVTQAPTGYKESPTQFKENQGWTVAQPSDAMLRGKWWEIFNEPELNALEEQLDINNQNIKQFFENFMAARAIVRQARAQYFPTLTTVPSANRSRSSGSLGNGTSTANPGRTSSVFSLPLEASWAPDLGARFEIPFVKRSIPRK